ncbi:MAG: lysophospholipase [Gammaproteobacteria bacterium]|nr:lysophospholipase [Gammaproteobacteria bacterium]MDH4316583.1 lysophospholipase [Gammaproteobacteria bacterium]MDH5213935.1 lysophospholipase [Gammaproteobacteria bacterium]
MPFLSRLSLRLLGMLLAVCAAIYLLRAVDSRSMPDLGPEHRVSFEAEFSADKENEVDWQTYVQIEDALAAELDTEIRKSGRSNSLLDRYSADSLTFPGRFDRNWNRSFEIPTQDAQGAAVLLHGLTDSPYSLLSIAETLAGAGYNVVVPRMPGHGFAVGGLRQVHWEDWTAAVRIAVRHAKQLPGGDQSLVIAGYSNGGLIAIDYALRCVDENVPCPDALILLSPAVAVTPLAAVTNWHSVISWIPFFEKFGWLSVLPEIDPFKFTSFPKRAGWEIYRISRRVHRQLETPARVRVLPPILTFQSVVDDTVSSAAIVENLYSKLPANGSELVVYDVNRNNTAIHLMRQKPDDPLEHFSSVAPLAYGVTVLRNRDVHSNQIDAATLTAGSTGVSTTRTGLSWPTSVYSLSHIALPFRSDDRLYGDGRTMDPDDSDVVFGAMAPRGERGVLLLSPEFFLRARHNPFYEYQAATILRWIASN